MTVCMYIVHCVCGPFANDNNVGQIVSRLASGTKKYSKERKKIRNDDDTNYFSLLIEDDDDDDDGRRR